MVSPILMAGSVADHSPSSGAASDIDGGPSPPRRSLVSSNLNPSFLGWSLSSQPSEKYDTDCRSAVKYVLRSLVDWAKRLVFPSQQPTEAARRPAARGRLRPAYALARSRPARPRAADGSAQASASPASPAADR